MKRSNIPKFVFCPQSRDAVKCVGEPLDSVLWQGKQWAVTTYGLECRDGCYHVESHYLWDCVPKKDASEEDAFIYWWQHISGKNWVDKDDIDAALQAFVLLYDRKGNRRVGVPAPALIEENDVESFALQAGERAYQDAKKRALKGLA